MTSIGHSEECEPKLKTDRSKILAHVNHRMTNSSEAKAVWTLIYKLYAELIGGKQSPADR